MICVARPGIQGFAGMTIVTFCRPMSSGCKFSLHGRTILGLISTSLCADFRQTRGRNSLLSLLEAEGDLGKDANLGVVPIVVIESIGDEQLDVSEGWVSCLGHCLLMVWAYLGAGFGHALGTSSWE